MLRGQCGRAGEQAVLWAERPSLGASGSVRFSVILGLGLVRRSAAK